MKHGVIDHHPVRSSDCRKEGFSYLLMEESDVVLKQKPVFN